jgi:hypothetical protein
MVSSTVRKSEPSPRGGTRSRVARSAKAGPTAGAPVGSAVGVGAAEGLLRVNCALTEAKAEAEFVRGGEGDRVGLREGCALATDVRDCEVLEVTVVEPP